MDSGRGVRIRKERRREDIKTERNTKKREGKEGKELEKNRKNRMGLRVTRCLKEVIIGMRKER